MRPPLEITQFIYCLKQQKLIINHLSSYLFQNMKTRESNEEEPFQIHSLIKFEKNYWSLREQVLYFLYVKENIRLFATEKLRRQHKVFTVFSKLVQSRTSYQIKSRHKSILKNYKSLENYIEQFDRQYFQQIRQFQQKLSSKPDFRWNFLRIHFGNQNKQNITRRQFEQEINEPASIQNNSMQISAHVQDCYQSPGSFNSIIQYLLFDMDRQQKGLSSNQVVPF